MTDTILKLEEILGDGRLKTIATQDDVESKEYPINSTDISCECGTLILKPKQAKLIIPSESMLEVEKELKFLQHIDKSFKNLVRGCYWLVDDMYKFEQMGFTKEIDNENQLKTLRIVETQNSSPKEDVQSQQSQTTPFADQSSVLNGLRYLVCAECNLCPLGWFDPKTKESYLYVW